MWIARSHRVPILARKKPQAMPAAFKNSECMRNLHKQINLAYARKNEQLYPYISADLRSTGKPDVSHTASELSAGIIQFMLTFIVVIEHTILDRRFMTLTPFKKPVVTIIADKPNVSNYKMTIIPSFFTGQPSPVPPSRCCPYTTPSRCFLFEDQTLEWTNSHVGWNCPSAASPCLP